MTPDIFGVPEVQVSWLLMSIAGADALGAAVKGWREQRDARELTRLDLVGLASEIATVASRIDEDLPPTREDAQVQELRSGCQLHRDRALILLSPETRFEALSHEALLDALNLLREDHWQLMQLWDEAEGLIEAWRAQAASARNAGRVPGRWRQWP